jgi:tRNA(Ile)-lysidine synthetase-like protein
MTLQKKSNEIINLINQTNRIITNQNIIKPTQFILITISGGQDSLCLFFILLQLKRQWKWHFGIFYSNHFWQIDSFYINSLVFKLGFLFSIPSYLSLPSENIFSEQKSRTWRYRQFKRLNHFYNYDIIITGHTATDRIETILLNLIRGTSTRGLSTLNWIRDLSRSDKETKRSSSWEVKPIFSSVNKRSLLTLPFQGEGGENLTPTERVSWSKQADLLSQQPHSERAKSISKAFLREVVSLVLLRSSGHKLFNLTSNCVTFSKASGSSEQFQPKSFTKDKLDISPLRENSSLVESNDSLLYDELFLIQFCSQSFSQYPLSSLKSSSFYEKKNLSFPLHKKAKQYFFHLLTKNIDKRLTSKRSRPNNKRRRFIFCAYTTLNKQSLLTLPLQGESSVGALSTSFIRCAPAIISSSMTFKKKFTSHQANIVKEKTKIFFSLHWDNKTKATVKSKSEYYVISNKYKCLSFSFNTIIFKKKPSKILIKWLKGLYWVTFKKKFAELVLFQSKKLTLKIDVNYKPGFSTIDNNLIKKINKNAQFVIPSRREFYLSQINNKKYFIIRPLLFITRFDLKKVCTLWKLPIYPDQTNEKLIYLRNRIRKQLLPLLRFFFNPQIDKLFLQFTEIANTEQLYLDNLSIRLLEEFQIKRINTFELNLSVFNFIPLAIQRRLLKQFIDQYLVKKIKFFHIEILLKLLTKRKINKSKSYNQFSSNDTLINQLNLKIQSFKFKSKASSNKKDYPLLNNQRLLTLPFQGAIFASRKYDCDSKFVLCTNQGFSKLKTSFLIKFSVSQKSPWVNKQSLLTLPLRGEGKLGSRLQVTSEFILSGPLISLKKKEGKIFFSKNISITHNQSRFLLKYCYKKIIQNRSESNTYLMEQSKLSNYNTSSQSSFKLSVTYGVKYKELLGSYNLYDERSSSFRKKLDKNPLSLTNKGLCKSPNTYLENQILVSTQYLNLFSVTKQSQDTKFELRKRLDFRKAATLLRSKVCTLYKPRFSPPGETSITPRNMSKKGKAHNLFTIKNKLETPQISLFFGVGAYFIASQRLIILHIP